MKALFGMSILVVLGFIVFVTISGFGYALAITLMILPWWQIVAGTVVGSVMVVIYLLSEIISNSKEGK